MADLMLFTQEQAARLAGLSEWQLAYWDHSGFYRPEHQLDRRTFSRLYGFKDVVGLRAIAIMHKRYGVSLHELRRVKKQIDVHHGPWSELTFFVSGKKGHHPRVYWVNPRTGKIEGTRPPGQVEMPIQMEQVNQDTRRKVEELRQRQETDYGRIVRKRYVAHNSAVLAGTRVTTAAVWDFHQAGYSAAEIIRQYPRLTERDVAGALAWERKLRAAS